MTFSKISNRLTATLVLSVLPALHGADVQKANNTDALSSNSSWVDAVLPTAADVITYGSLNTASSTPTSIGTGISILGIRYVSNPANNLVISAGTGNLTLGSAGIDLSSGNRTLTINSPVTLAANQTWTTGTANAYTSQLVANGIISGSGALTINGTVGSPLAQVHLNALHTFSGGVTLNSGGALRLSAAAPTISSNVTVASSIGTGNLTINGGTIFGSGGTISPPTITVNSDFSVNHGAAANTGNGRFTIAGGTMDLTGGIRTVSLGRYMTAVNAMNSGNETFRFLSGGSAVAGTLTNVVVSNGTIRFVIGAGANTASDFVSVTLGGMTFSPGTGLTIGQNVITTMSTGNPFGTTAGSQPNVTVESGGYFNMSDATNARNPVIRTLSGNGTVTNLSNNTTAATATLTINPQAGDIATFAGNIVNGTSVNATLGTVAGAGSVVALTKTGAGTQILSGNNTYSGATTLTTGTLVFANTAARSASTTVTAAAGTTVGLGVGGAGFYSSTDVTNLFGGSLTGFSLNAATNVALDTTAGNFDYTGASGSVTRSLTKLGNNTLTLSGSNDYSGGTFVNAGTLRIGNANALGANSGAVVVTSGAALDLNGTTMLGTNALTLNGTGIGGTGALTNSASGAATYAGLVSLGSASSILAGTGNITLANVGTITGSGFGLTVGGAANTTILSIIGTGAGTLAKQDAGILTLSGANTYTGGTSVTGGTVRIANATALGGNAGSATVSSGAALDLNGTVMTGTNALTLNGNGIGGTGALTNSAVGSGTYAGLISLGSSSSIIAGTGNITLSNVGTITGSGFDLTIGGAANTTIASIIGTGSGTLIKQDAGALTLTGASTFTGGVTLNAGTININSNGVVGASGPLGNGGTFTINGGTIDNTSGGARVLANVNPITVGGNFDFSTAAGTSSNNLTLPGAVDLGGVRTITTNGAGTLALTGVIGGASSGIIKEGTGVLLLSGASTFTGGVTVNSGTLTFGGSSTNSGSTVSNGPTGTGDLTFNNTATLTSNATGNILLVPTLSLNGTLNTGGTQRMRIGWSTLELNGGSRTVNLNSNGKAVTGGNTLASETTGQWTIESQSTLSNPGSVRNGTLNLQTTNYSGGTYGLMLLGSMTYSNASITVGPNVILGLNGNQGSNGTNSAAINVQSGGILNMTNASRSIGSLSGGGNVFNSMVVTGNSSVTLTLVSTSGTSDFSGVLSNGPAGTLGLSKTGAGSTQILSGANTYSGNTSITGGTLLVNNTTGSGTGSGTVTIGSSAILGGSGTIAGNTTISGSLRPGNSIGELTVSNDVTWNSGSPWVFELGTGGTILSPGTSDRLRLTGAGNDFLKGTGAAGSFEFDFAGTGTVGWYQLISWESLTASNFYPGDFTATNLAADLIATFTVTDTIGAQGIYLNLTVVPEPGAYILMVAGLGLAVWMRRRGRRAA